MPSATAPGCFAVMTFLMVLAEAKFYRPFQYNTYKTGSSQHHDLGKPTSRHKNHCAYVVEKMVSFTMQDGVAPYVKAEYNKCSWGQKCPTLLYRLMYKPVYKVAHKTLSELEWRCCPGHSGYGCMDGPLAYQHPVKMMPPFQGPHVKGLQLKGPLFKGPAVYPGGKANTWSQPKGPGSSMNTYPMHHFRPLIPSSYPETPYEPYQPQPQPIPDHKDPHPSELEPEHEHEPEHQHEHEIEEQIQEEGAPPAGREETEGRTAEEETAERLDRMEDDVRRLSQGLENLQGTVNGLEDSLRASLREDANRMLSTLLSAAPSPIAAPALPSSHSAIGFGDIPGGGPEADGIDGGHVLPDPGELSVRMEELRAELRAKTAELRELRATVTGHDGALKMLSGGTGTPSGVAGAQTRDAERTAEKSADAKLSGAQTEILSGLEKRVEGAEVHCEERTSEVRRQCRREQAEQREKMEQAIEGSAVDLRKELGALQVQIRDLAAAEGCCGRAGGLTERVQLLEQSMAGLNQSQRHLQVALGGHTDHIQGILEGRLGYVEAKLNLTGKEKGGEMPGAPAGDEMEDGLEAAVEGKLKALEDRLLAAVEELGNATAPALLEGHAVPTLETELESLRRRLEMDVDRVQKHLSSLEILCSSSCPPSTPPAVQGDAAASGLYPLEEESMKQALHMQAERLESLNATLQDLLSRPSLIDRQDREGEDSSIQGEVTVLKFNVRSMNRTLRGLRSSVGAVVHQMGEANSTWLEREERLAQQMKGVVQLVGRQASMLGAGERRLTRLKAELQEMRRRLAGEVQGCRSTALGIQKEVTEVGGRMATVEDQCKGLGNMVEDLERIREELERQSDGLLSQINGTLYSHTQQLSDLKDGLRHCTSKVEPTQTSVGVEPERRRGDSFTLI